MTIHQEILENQSAYTAKERDILRGLQYLADIYGADRCGPWAVIRTQFHGGGVISRHKSAYRAAEAARKYSSNDCQCGCCGVIPADEIDNLPSADECGAFHICR